MSQYKDSFFRTVFNTGEAALDVYNALHDTAYDERAEVIIKYPHRDLVDVSEK